MRFYCTDFISANCGMWNALEFFVLCVLEGGFILSSFGAGSNTIMALSFTLFKRILLHRQVIQQVQGQVAIPFTSSYMEIKLVFLVMRFNWT